MSSIYLYIIYISRPWFKGSGAAAGSGSISGTSILLCPFCRYVIVHTNHHFARKREYSDGHPSHLLLQLVGKTDACQRGLIKNTPDVVRRPACFVVKGVQGCGFRVQGSGLWWRLRRMLDDGIFISSAFPKGEGLDGATLRVNLYKERSPIKNHSRPFLWKGQTSEARRGWHPRV